MHVLAILGVGNINWGKVSLCDFRGGRFVNWGKKYMFVILGMEHMSDGENVPNVRLCDLRGGGYVEHSLSVGSSPC